MLAIWYKNECVIETYEVFITVPRVDEVVMIHDKLYRVTNIIHNLSTRVIIVNVQD